MQFKLINNYEIFAFITWSLHYRNYLLSKTSHYGDYFRISYKLLENSFSEVVKKQASFELHFP